MIIHLPNDGLQILRSFFVSPTGTLSLVLLLVLVWFSKKSNKPVVVRSPKSPPLGLLEVILATAIWFGSDFLFWGFKKPFFDKLLLLGRNASVLVLGIWLPVVLNRKQDKNNLVLLGRFSPFSKLVTLGLTAGAIITVFVLGTSLLLPFKFHIASTRILSPERIGLYLLVTLLIPATEELLFRWYLYFYLRSSCGIILGVLISSAIFSVAHGISVYSVMIFGQAIVLTLLVEYTRSIIPGLILHSGYNFILYMGGYWVT